MTARTTVPHVRVHVPERALTCWLLLDLSPSMTFGTADRRKADVAEGVALAVGHLTASAATGSASRRSAARDVRLQPPAVAGRYGCMLGGRSRPIAIDAARRAGATSPADALEFVGHAAPRGGLVIVVSDFRGPRDWSRRWPPRRRARSSPSRSAIPARTS